MRHLEPPRLTPTARQANGWPGFSAAEFTFHTAALIWLITCVTLWVGGYALVRFAPVPLPDVARLRAPFLPWAVGEVAPEPQERRLYLLLTLLAPLVVLAGWAVTRRVAAGRASGTSVAAKTRLSDWTVAGGALIFCFGGVSLYLVLTASIVKDVLRPVAGSALLPVLGLSLVLWWVLGCGLRRSWRSWRRVAKTWRVLTLAGALALALGAGMVARVFDYFTAPELVPFHANSALYSIPQASNGQHILVDFVPLYGCYAEFLKPWFSLIGLSVLRMTATLAVLQALAMAAVVFTLARLLRSRVLLCLVAAAFAWMMHVWSSFANAPLDTPLALTGFDPYYQYYPIRLLFPALTLLAVWWYLCRPSSARASCAGALGGLAVWWNVDTGAVVLASIVILLAVEACSEWRARPPGDRWRAGQRLLAAIGAAALALTVFYLIICVNAWQMVTLSRVLYYQSIYYVSGFTMLPMPMTLSTWHLVIGIYLLGLTHGLKRALAGRRLAIHDAMVLYLSVLGLGLFSYYQGRSHDNVLMLCDWPAVALAVLLCDRLLAATRYGLLPRLYSAIALPMLMLGTACAFCLWLTHRSIVATEISLWQAHVQRIATPQTDAVGYLKRSVPRGESSCVISVYQAIYAASTGQRPGLAGPSFFDYVLKSDAEHLVAQINSRQVRHLFTEAGIFPENYGVLGLGYRDAVHRAYRLVGSNPAGNMLHWESRPDGTLGAFPEEFAARRRLNVSPPAVRHAVRCAAPNVLLDAGEECVGGPPYNWGSVSFGSNFAIEMIVTPAVDQPDNACLISNYPGLANDGLAVQRTSGTKAADNYACFFGEGRLSAASAPFVLSSGEEHYLVVSCEANHVSIYVDGQLNQQLQLDGPVSLSATKLTLGDWFSAGRHFAGEIAEIKIHEHALSATVAADTWKQVAANPKKADTAVPPDP